jgi:hypothetical protein
MATFHDPGVREVDPQHVANLVAYRTAAAGELVDDMLQSADFPEEWDRDSIRDALLDAFPYDREFVNISNVEFWTIAAPFHAGWEDA